MLRSLHWHAVGLHLSATSVQDGRYRLSAAWHLRDARIYSPLPTVRAFGRIAPPVGSEEAPIEELASVRRTNRAYSFPVSGFHERAFVICSEGMSETRLISLNSVRNRLVGYSLHAALRQRLVRCDHSRRIIQPSS
jgi:hypothetical protein